MKKFNENYDITVQVNNNDDVIDLFNSTIYNKNCNKKSVFVAIGPKVENANLIYENLTFNNFECEYIEFAEEDFDLSEFVEEHNIQNFDELLQKEELYKEWVA